MEEQRAAVVDSVKGRTDIQKESSRRLRQAGGTKRWSSEEKVDSLKCKVWAFVNASRAKRNGFDSNTCLVRFGAHYVVKVKYGGYLGSRDASTPRQLLNHNFEMPELGLKVLIFDFRSSM